MLLIYDLIYYVVSVLFFSQDVMILSQFMQEDGEIIPRQITKLCFTQHAKLKKLIHQAHTAGTVCLIYCSIVKVHVCWS